MDAKAHPLTSQQNAGRLWHDAWAIAPMAVVLLIFLWYISAGTWTSWPETAIYDYYNSLATSFRAGQLQLLDEPAAELLALPDPYRIGARKSIPYLWDASLFHDHYYLYWGPVPALLLLPIRAVAGIGQIPDLHLAFAFVTALYLVLCVLIMRIWRLRYAHLPRWTLALGLLIAGLAPPLTWMLNRPEVYEAAIAAGQFFLLAGLYSAWTATDRIRPSIWRLALASICWALAVGSRNSQAIPVLFLLACSVFAILGARGKPLSAPILLGSLAAVLLPVALGALSLLWYNWARFGSALEFGYRFQLTLLQMPKHYEGIFSPAYVWPNLRNYLVNPFDFSQTFPFIMPRYGSEFAGRAGIPDIYFAEAVTGLLQTFPFMILALIPVGLGRRSGQRASTREPGVEVDGSLEWLHAALAGVFLLESGMLLMFFFAAERYLADVVPSLTLLSLIGFWHGCTVLRNNARLRKSLTALAVILASISVVTSGLLAVSSAQDRFLRMNPALIEQINRLLGQ